MRGSSILILVILIFSGGNFKLLYKEKKSELPEAWKPFEKNIDHKREHFIRDVVDEVRCINWRWYDQNSPWRFLRFYLGQWKAIFWKFLAKEVTKASEKHLEECTNAMQILYHASEPWVTSFFLALSEINNIQNIKYFKRG